MGRSDPSPIGYATSCRFESWKVNQSLGVLMQDLTEAMNAHLRLHFVNDELADQNVLSIYPSTLRRRALRHLYMRCAQG